MGYRLRRMHERHPSGDSMRCHEPYMSGAARWLPPFIMHGDRSMPGPAMSELIPRGQLNTSDRRGQGTQTMERSQMQVSGGLLPFLEENGLYVFLSTLCERPFRFTRNRLLAARFGVKQINLGPRPYLRGLSHVFVGEDFSAGTGLWLEAITQYRDQRFTPKISIGSHVRVSHWSHITCTNSVTIGDHVLIGSKVMITDHNHGSFGIPASPPEIPPVERPLESDRFVKIGEKVWLGDGVVVCPGVEMGEGSVAGANAVVTTDVLAHTLVAGVPARPIRRYDANMKSWVPL